MRVRNSILPQVCVDCKYPRCDQGCGRKRSSEEGAISTKYRFRVWTCRDCQGKVAAPEPDAWWENLDKVRQYITEHQREPPRSRKDGKWLKEQQGKEWGKLAAEQQAAHLPSPSVDLT